MSDEKPRYWIVEQPTDNPEHLVWTPILGGSAMAQVIRDCEAIEAKLAAAEARAEDMRKQLSNETDALAQALARVRELEEYKAMYEGLCK